MMYGLFLVLSLFCIPIYAAAKKEKQQCEVCHGLYANLKRHARVHTGEKPYTCRTGCKKTFADLKTRINHEYIHTGAKPFRCNFCSHTFRQLGQRNTHVKICILKYVETRPRLMALVQSCAASLAECQKKAPQSSSN